MKKIITLHYFYDGSVAIEDSKVKTQSDFDFFHYYSDTMCLSLFIIGCPKQSRELNKNVTYLTAPGNEIFTLT